MNANRTNAMITAVLSAASFATAVWAQEVLPKPAHPDGHAGPLHAAEMK